MRGLLLLLVLCAGPAWAQIGPLGPPGLPASRYPAPAREVASIISDRWGNEDSRERAGEAGRVLDFLHVGPGMVVADIGAGSGYYVPRLSARVGPGGRVLAQDVVPAYLTALAARVQNEGLGNVSVGLGDVSDPRLPPGSVDVAILIHMYHEIGAPYALMANLVPALRPGAVVGIVDTTRKTQYHGTPPALLDCEMAAVGYRRVGTLPMENGTEYLAVFTPPATAPAPQSIAPCKP